jgi:hypothetical protein
MGDKICFRGRVVSSFSNLGYCGGDQRTLSFSLRIDSAMPSEVVQDRFRKRR